MLMLDVQGNEKVAMRTRAHANSKNNIHSKKESSWSKLKYYIFYTFLQW